MKAPSKTKAANFAFPPRSPHPARIPAAPGLAGSGQCLLPIASDRAAAPCSPAGTELTQLPGTATPGSQPGGTGHSQAEEVAVAASHNLQHPTTTSPPSPELSEFP